MRNNKIFFSYTLRDSEINIDILLSIKNKFRDYSTVETYFDILDNCSPDHQGYVYKVLEESNILCLIKSSDVNSSSWVGKELYIARQRNIPIIEINKKDINQILNCNSRDEFMKNSKVEEMIFANM